MLKRNLSTTPPLHKGSSLLEVLITVLILSFGLLGLAGLQNKNQQALQEAYQRAQALLLLSDLSERMNANRVAAPNYVFANTLGTGDSQPENCNSLPVTATKDLCEWSNALKGSAELSTNSSNSLSGGDTSRIGAMIDARGCIEQLQAPDSSSGVCKPGIYKISVVWQGVNKTSVPTNSTCGEGQYGDDAYRRVLTQQVSVGLLSCL